MSGHGSASENWRSGTGNTSLGSLLLDDTRTGFSSSTAPDSDVEPDSDVLDAALRDRVRLGGFRMLCELWLKIEGLVNSPPKLETDGSSGVVMGGIARASEGIDSDEVMDCDTSSGRWLPVLSADDARRSGKTVS